VFSRAYALFFFLIVGLGTSLCGQVVFSEIMFDVPGADYYDEFVELYNCSDSTVDLSGWQFSDSSAIDLLVDAGYGMLLKPGQFAVILDGSYFGHSTTYDSIIPSQALILTINDNALGQNGLANTHGERLYLFDASGRIVATYRYSADNAPGFSDEKIKLCAGDMPENWANSLVKGGTPGFVNSVTPAGLDVGLGPGSLQIFPHSAVKRGQVVQGRLRIANLGEKRFRGEIGISVFYDWNENYRKDQSETEVFADSAEWDIAVQRSDSLAFKFVAEIGGQIPLSARLQSSLDQKEENNTARTYFTVVDGAPTLALNEIKFLTFEGEAEWVELYNFGRQAVPLRGWGIADERDTARIEQSRFLLPDSFVVLTGDSALLGWYDLNVSQVCVLARFPTLNNDADILYLIPPWGGWAEQVHYEKSWLGAAAAMLPSLERINPRIDARQEGNWGPCAAAQKATPARVNSLFEPLAASHLKIKIHPNPFSPDGDGIEDRALIELRIPAHAAQVRVVVYDVLGRKVRTLWENHFSGQEAQLVWDGCDEQKKKVRIGLYVVFVQILDAAHGILQNAKTTVTVAR
jgi:hypothetical protein